MSIQLSLFWQTVEHIEWYWPGDTNVYTGSLEELLDQKQERNLDICVSRLFLPEYWFSTIELTVPENTRRLSGQALKFASEEYLAQDIDSVHLVLKNKPQGGVASVLVTELERFKLLLSTLQTRGVNVVEAYDCQQFLLPDAQTDDIVIQVAKTDITLWSQDQVFKVHPRGFPQWFELWAAQYDIADTADIQLISESSEGSAKAIVTVLEASGHTVQWVVQDAKKLIDWHDQAENKTPAGNLITSEFGQKSSRAQFNLWVPSVAAGLSAFLLWTVMTVIQNNQLNTRIEQTWQASENVFKQVFGRSKRIQRPLMVREMSTLAAANGGQASDVELNALYFLNDLSIAAPSLKLEDFRYTSDRKESMFTLVQDVSEQGDAFNFFETLKNGLGAKGYVVEYSANQDKDGFRARFKSTYGKES